MQKLCFSTRAWEGYTFDELCSAAVDMNLKGIEIHNPNGQAVNDKTSPFHKYQISATGRKLYELKLKTPCIDAVCDISDESCAEQSINEIISTLEIAENLRIPYLRIHALEGTKENSIALIEKVLDKAHEKNVVLLIETVGIFADTKLLREVLNHFASDSLAALWDFHHPWRDFGEDAQTTITNLGAYVRHVHIKDSELVDEKVAYCLTGEGELPISDMMKALASVNYDGYISLEWDPKWMPEVNDIEIILSFFESYMHRFTAPSRAESHLYSNNTHTGKFIWKKETLIEHTFSEVLDKMVEEFPDQQAFKFTTLDYTRTYSEFRDDVDTFARALIDLGVKPGDKVSVWATNIPQWFVTFWATVKIGAVLVTVNTAYKIHEAEYLFSQSDTHTLVMIDGYRDSNYAGIVQEICPELQTTKSGSPLHAKRLPFLRNVITVGFSMPGCMTWEEALDRSENVSIDVVNKRAAAVNPHDVANMQYTSGTTGFPKGVMLTHYNIVNNGKTIGDRMDLSTADRMMIQVPMFHCFGMVLAMTACMSHGCSMLPLPYFSPRPALACINSERITAFHGVPTMFIALLEHEDFPKTDFSYMRTGIMAGSPCPISVMQDVLNKMNMNEITIVYGQTEASPGCTMSFAHDSMEVRVGTVGSALPEIECKIVDPETGEDMPVGETGEFVARGYNIMKGYYKMPMATASAIDKDGWLHTGDLACMTEEGNFKITGRLKDMIIRGGENIYPKEIEEFIYTHDKVKDVQVIGVPDEQYGEEIMACIILKEGEEISEKEMKDFILASMARHKVPKYIDFVDSFPMNAAGKIQKYVMRDNAVKKLNLQKAANIVTA